MMKNYFIILDVFKHPFSVNIQYFISSIFLDSKPKVNDGCLDEVRIFDDQPVLGWFHFQTCILSFIFFFLIKNHHDEQQRNPCPDNAEQFLMCHISQLALPIRYNQMQLWLHIDLFASFFGKDLLLWFFYLYLRMNLHWNYFMFDKTFIFFPEVC